MDSVTANKPKNSPLRIAILGCDNNIPAALEKYKSYAHICSSLLEAGAEAAGLKKDDDLEISLWQVVDQVGQFPDLENVDGVMLSGS
ncbi:MAG: hypothetical protein Q9226_000563, partial [Calogaya cf. arnoldii]